MASGHLQPEQTALLNHLILANIFKPCGTSDLKNFRLVCKAWDKEAHARLRRTVPLIVREYEEAPSDEVDYVTKLLSEAPPGTSCYINQSLRELVEHLDALEDAEKGTRLRYSTVVLQGWDFTTTPSDEQEMFLAACCEGIVDLHLIRCHLTITYHLKRFLTTTTQLESLTLDDKYFNRKTLTLSGSFQEQLREIGLLTLANINTVKSLKVFCSDPETEGVPGTTWYIFLKGFQNLEKVVLSSLERGAAPVVSKWNARYMGNGTGSDILYGLAGCCRQWRNEHKFRHVDISKLDSSASGFLRLSIAQTLKFESEWMPLTVLKIDIGLVETLQPALTASAVIKTFAASLETLVLIRAPYTTTPFPPPFDEHDFKFLQRMETLQTLELVGSVMFDLKFLQLTPNLRRLVISPMHRTKHSVDLMGDETFRRDSAPLHRLHPQFANLVVGAEVELSNAELVLESLTELEIGYPLGEGPKSVELLGRWLPNLETLRIPATAEVFRGICSRWGHSLHTLELQNPSILNDADITGIGKGDSASSPPQPPNVSCLKELKSFQMEHPHPIFHTPSECDHLIPQLTGRSVVHGFAKLEKLQNLKIFVTKKLGKKCLQALDARRGELSVVVEVVENCQCNLSRRPRRSCRR